MIAKFFICYLPFIITSSQFDDVAVFSAPPSTKPASEEHCPKTAAKALIDLCFLLLGTSQGSIT